MFILLCVGSSQGLHGAFHLGVSSPLAGRVVQHSWPLPELEKVAERWMDPIRVSSHELDLSIVQQVVYDPHLFFWIS